MFAAPKHINKTRDDKRVNMSVHALASCLVQAKILPDMYAAHKGYIVHT